MKTTLMLITAALLTACAGTGTDTTSAGTAAGVKPYPLDTCIVTDNELGSMGPVITQVHGDQQVKFCCAPCVRKFNADPDRYLAKIN